MSAIKMTYKHKLMAYVLNKELGYTMVNIGKLMAVAQSTISNAVKEIEYERRIKNLQRELEETRALLREKGFEKEITLNPVLIDVVSIVK